MAWTFELIEKRWPRIWGALNNRPARLIVLVMSLVFLGKDFQDAIAIARAPIVNIAPPPAPMLGDPPQKRQFSDDMAERKLSLKKRLVTLANEIEMWTDDVDVAWYQVINKPEFQNLPQLEKSSRERTHTSETQNEFSQKFRRQVLAMLREAQGMGLDVYYLEGSVRAYSDNGPVVPSPFVSSNLKLLADKL